MPELPHARRARFQEHFALSDYDAEVLTASRPLADYFEDVARAHGDAKVAANWVMGEVLAAINEKRLTIERFPVTPGALAALLDLTRAGTVSHSAAKRVFAVMAATGESPGAIAEREGLLQVGDDTQLVQWIDAVLRDHPDEARRFLAGEKKLLGVLVGLVMKRSGGRADPRKVNQLLNARVAA